MNVLVGRPNQIAFSKHIGAVCRFGAKMRRFNRRISPVAIPVCADFRIQTHQRGCQTFVSDHMRLIQ